MPTFGNKSRKTTKSYPSTGDQFCESRKTTKFDAPVGLLGRVSRTGSNYDSLEEAQWQCLSFCKLSENRGKRQSPIRLRGISWGNENFCLNLFQQNSVPCRADRWVNGGSNKEPRSVIHLHAQVISTVVESVFPVSLPPPAGRAAQGITGARPGFGTRTGKASAQRPGRAGHATGDRAPERDPVFGHTTRFRHAACSTDAP